MTLPRRTLHQHRQGRRLGQRPGCKTDVKAENRVENVDSSGNVLTTAREGKKGLKTNNTEEITKGVVNAMTNGTSYEGLFHYDDIEPGSETKRVAEGTENLVYQAAEAKSGSTSISPMPPSPRTSAARSPVAFSMVPGAPDTPTVTGTFHVYLKYDVQTMRGENADGTKYETEGVPWVTYFTGSYAMHGAPWRSSFGWSGYGGSHGCVNHARRRRQVHLRLDRHGRHGGRSLLIAHAQASGAGRNRGVPARSLLPREGRGCLG